MIVLYIAVYLDLTILKTTIVTRPALSRSLRHLRCTVAMLCAPAMLACFLFRPTDPGRAGKYTLKQKADFERPQARPMPRPIEFDRELYNTVTEQTLY